MPEVLLQIMHMLIDPLLCVQMVMDPLSTVLDDGPDPLSDLLAASDPLSAQTYTASKKVSTYVFIL